MDESSRGERETPREKRRKGQVAHRGLSATLNTARKRPKPRSGSFACTQHAQSRGGEGKFSPAPLERPCKEDRMLGREQRCTPECCRRQLGSKREEEEEAEVSGGVVQQALSNGASLPPQTEEDQLRARRLIRKKVPRQM